MFRIQKINPSRIESMEDPVDPDFRPRRNRPAEVEQPAERGRRMGEPVLPFPQVASGMENVQLERKPDTPAGHFQPGPVRNPVEIVLLGRA